MMVGAIAMRHDRFGKRLIVDRDHLVTPSESLIFCPTANERRAGGSGTLRRMAAVAEITEYSLEVE